MDLYFVVSCVNCLRTVSLNKNLTEETHEHSHEIEEEQEQVLAKDLHCCELCDNELYDFCCTEYSSSFHLLHNSQRE